MSTITICKSYKIEYAHHIEHQRITECNPEVRCRSIHGHSGLVKIYIRRKDNLLDSIGMVIDFTELKPVKNFIDNFDHAMILSFYDPSVSKFTDLEKVKHWFAAHDNEHLFIEFPRLVILRYPNISSEIIARFMFSKISDDILPKIDTILELVKLEFSETDNNMVIIER